MILPSFFIIFYYREAEKGPGWYYEVVPLKEGERPPQEELEPDLASYKKYERCCAKCEGVSTPEWVSFIFSWIILVCASILGLNMDNSPP